MPVNPFSHFHLPFIVDQKSQDLRLVYALRFFKDLISKIAGFFVPLYLYQLSLKLNWFQNFELSQLQIGILIIASYSFLMRMTTLVTSVWSGKIIALAGTRFALLISLLCQSSWLLALQFSQSQPKFIYLAAIFSGLEISFFYNTFFTSLSRITHKRHAGQDLGGIQLLLQLASVIAPALGGLVIVVLGYDVLFLLAFIGVLVNLVIISLMKTRKFKILPTFGQMRSWLKEKQYQSLAFSYMGRYFNDGALALWPLYVFLILGSVDRVGYLYSFSLFLAMIIVAFSGIYVDHHKGRKPFLMSGGVMSLVWLLRSQVVGVWTIAMIDTFDKMTSSFHWLFYDAMFFKRAKGSRDLAFFSYRETIISFIAIVFWIMVGVIFLLPFSWMILFMIASIGVLMSLSVTDKYEH